MLGSKICIDLLKKELRKIQKVIRGVEVSDLSRNLTSWKFPKLMARDVNVGKLVEAVEYEANFSAYNEALHIFLLELIVDRFVYILGMMCIYVENLHNNISLNDQVDQNGYRKRHLISEVVARTLNVLIAKKTCQQSQKQFCEAAVSTTTSDSATDGPRINASMQTENFTRVTSVASSTSLENGTVENGIQTENWLMAESLISQSSITEDGSNYREQELERRIGKLTQERKHLSSKLRICRKKLSSLEADLSNERTTREVFQDTLSKKLKIEERMRKLLTEHNHELHPGNDTDSELENQLSRILEDYSTIKKIKQEETLATVHKIDAIQNNSELPQSAVKHRLELILSTLSSSSSILIGRSPSITKICEMLDELRMKLIEQNIMLELEKGDMDKVVQDANLKSFVNFWPILSSLHEKISQLKMEISPLVIPDLSWLKYDHEDSRSRSKSIGILELLENASSMSSSHSVPRHKGTLIPQIDSELRINSNSSERFALKPDRTGNIEDTTNSSSKKQDPIELWSVSLASKRSNGISKHEARKRASSRKHRVNL